MSQAKISTPSRQQRRLRTVQLRERGLTWEQIADVWEADKPEITPRAAFRLAHVLTHEQIAELWNNLDPGQPTMSKSRIYELEVWPNKGRRPSVANLRMLARIYNTTGERLLTKDELARYEASDRVEISAIDYRCDDENRPEQEMSTARSPRKPPVKRTISGQKLKAVRRREVGTVDAMEDALRKCAPEYDRKSLPTKTSLMRMIRSWESGRHDLSERYQLLYCRVLDMDIHEFFELVKDEETAAAAVADNKHLDDAHQARLLVNENPIEQAHGKTFGECMRALIAERAISLRKLAKSIPADVGHLSKISRDLKSPSEEMAERIDDALDARGALAAMIRPYKAAGQEENRHGSSVAATETHQISAKYEVQSLVDWVGETNTSDEAIEQMARASVYLAEAHSKIPPKKVLTEVLNLHTQAQVLLRSGKQRLRQTRALLRVESDLLSHACLLLGDLGQDKEAAKYGAAALLFAQEADASQAIAWSVRAKTARWQHRYVESAELASRGYEVSASTPTRVELAYREANAIALFGDSERAQRALRRAHKAAESLSELESGDSSVWSFPIERQAIFALSVAIYTGDADSALRAAEMADNRWATGHRRVAANWAQIRAGAAMAYLMKGALDGVVDQITPVLELPPELRISTITRYLDNLDRLLTAPRFARSTVASKVREEIRAFKTTTPLEIAV